MAGDKVIFSTRSVSIESKRNGNLSTGQGMCTMFLVFQSNLRGMETDILPEGAIFLERVSIESKRNGNESSRQEYRQKV